jgi:thymidylate synthase (FAD)
MITVELIDSMGSDLSVVNAARVSFDKTSEWNIVEGADPKGNSRVLQFNEVLSDRDTKLIKYLATHNHWSPFAHCAVSFRVAAPIFVARQLQKHTVGLSWNEVSRRYVDSEPTFFVPETWRKRAENVKQGSSEEAAYPPSLWDFDDWHGDIYSHHQEAVDYYNHLLKAGVCPEQARMVLPQSMMTEWIWSGSLYAFARVCVLRLDSHTQKETQQVAKQISAYMATLFPVSWDALVTAVVQPTASDT